MNYLQKIIHFQMKETLNILTKLANREYKIVCSHGIKQNKYYGPYFIFTLLLSC